MKEIKQSGLVALNPAKQIHRTEIIIAIVVGYKFEGLDAPGELPVAVVKLGYIKPQHVQCPDRAFPVILSYYLCNTCKIFSSASESSNARQILLNLIPIE